MIYINLVLTFILAVFLFKLYKRKPLNGKDGKDGTNGIGVEYYKEGIIVRNKKGEVVIEYSKPLKK